MIKFSYYNNDKSLDRVWFDSSNVYYGECDDSSNTQYKTVRIVFKNGLMYQYNNVLITDWLDFKHAQSQGKAVREILMARGYEYAKLDHKADIEGLEAIADNIQNKVVTIELRKDDGYLVATDFNEKVISEIDFKAYDHEDVQYLLIRDIVALLKNVGYSVKLSSDLEDKFPIKD